MPKSKSKRPKIARHFARDKGTFTPKTIGAFGAGNHDKRILPWERDGFLTPKAYDEYHAERKRKLIAALMGGVQCT
jgi:hypothetical protein